MESRKCTATTRKGDLCRVWAVRGSDPPRCFAHFEERAHRPPPAEKEGNSLPPVEPGPPPETLDDLARDMGQKQATLSALIDREFAAPQSIVDLKLLCRLLTIYQQIAARHAHLLIQAAGGQMPDELGDAIAQALDELGIEWGIKPQST